MADPIGAAFTLGGFLAAHTFAAMAGSPHSELLVPVAYVWKEAGQKFEFFEADTQREAVEAGLATTRSLIGSSKAWAFAHEGYFTQRGEKADAFFILVWAEGATEPWTIVQRWKRVPDPGSTATSSLERIGNPVLIVAGRSQPLTDYQRRAFDDGAIQNIKAADAWAASEPE